MNEELKQVTEEIKQGVAESVMAPITEAVFEKIKSELPQRKDLFASENTNGDQVKKDEAVKFIKALTAGGSTAGSELVPTYVASEIVRVAELNGLARRYGRKWPMAGSNVNVPTATSVSAYRVNEGAKITSSAPVTGTLSLRGKTVGVLIPVSKKLLRNATVQLVDVLNTLAGEALAKLEDQWAVLGLNTGEGVFQTTGVPGVTLSSGNTTYAKVTPEDMLDMIDQVSANVSTEKLRWCMHRSIFNALRKQRAVVGSDKQGFLLQGYGSSAPSTMWDIPYDLSPIMPKVADGSQAGNKFMALIDWSNVIFGDSLNYSMELSEQATITDTDGSTLINLFEQDMVAIKVVGEVDIQIAVPTLAHAWAKTAAS